MAPWKTAGWPWGKPIVPSPTRPPCVLWMAPFLSGGGYSSEAWSYITALSRMMEEMENPPIRLTIDQHGDLGTPSSGPACRKRTTGAWAPSLFQTTPCPPGGAYAAALAVVGRTMFETDRVEPEHVRRCNRMDAVWVPTEFNAATFVGSGVEASQGGGGGAARGRLLLRPFQAPPVDTPLRGPSAAAGERPPEGKLRLPQYLQMGAVLGGGWGLPLHLDEPISRRRRRRRDPAEDLEFVTAAGLAAPEEGVGAGLSPGGAHPAGGAARLYKAADAFVLPSRGEGWGRPLVEAMAMELPVIATNWSGPAEFLTAENSYPLPSHLWAEPSVAELRALMRRVVRSPEEARRRGRRAREDMVRRFSPAVVASQVVDQVLRVSRVRQPMSA
ncbi:unnamed protein product [Spirodela intermedia]|uniref:Glycosyl transferase family 1 domain-containing protein n=1 Tax=Spirodela intermedia TaxID=51605 RepID=A0A7I8JEC4_SPIIN|nr:unnamed protein product [Spirodela intermedia]CAA6668467.1 unnamed protein product [Spirodela intermedia]